MPSFLLPTQGKGREKKPGKETTAEKCGIKMSVDEIKSNLKSKRLVLGASVAVKSLKRGSLSKVFLSSNCPESLKKDVTYYCGISGCPVESLDVPNDELGVICKKPFPVSVVGLLKQ